MHAQLPAMTLIVAILLDNTSNDATEYQLAEASGGNKLSEGEPMIS